MGTSGKKTPPYIFFQQRHQEWRESPFFKAKQPVVEEERHLAYLPHHLSSITERITPTKGLNSDTCLRLGKPTAGAASLV